MTELYQTLGKEAATKPFESHLPFRSVKCEFPPAHPLPFMAQRPPKQWGATPCQDLPLLLLHTLCFCWRGWRLGTATAASCPGDKDVELWFYSSFPVLLQRI